MLAEGPPTLHSALNHYGAKLWALGGDISHSSTGKNYTRQLFSGQKPQFRSSSWTDGIIISQLSVTDNAIVLE